MFLWALGSMPPANISLPTSRLQLSCRHPHMHRQSCLYQFYSQISEDIQVFSFFETFFTNFFYHGDISVENLLAAIDHRPVCPNVAPAWTLNCFLLDQNPWCDASHRCRCRPTRSTVVWFDPINWLLTTRGDCLMEMHANGAPLITIARILVWRELEKPIFGSRPTFSNHKKDSLLVFIQLRTIFDSSAKHKPGFVW